LALHQSWAPRSHFSSCKAPTPHHNYPTNVDAIKLDGRRALRVASRSFSPFATIASDLPCCWLLRLHAPAGSLDFVFFVKLREPGDATAALYFVYYRQPAIRNPFSLIFAYVESLKTYCLV
jgi:hypothetical protein